MDGAVVTDWNSSADWAVATQDMGNRTRGFLIQSSQASDFSSQDLENIKFWGYKISLCPEAHCVVQLWGVSSGHLI